MTHELHDHDRGQECHQHGQTSLKTDMVFSDGWSLQTPTVSGDVANGFTIAMNVAV